MLSERDTYAVDRLNEYLRLYEEQQDNTGRLLEAGTPITQWRNPSADRELARARVVAKRVLDEVAPQWRSALASKGAFTTEDKVIADVAFEQVILITEGKDIADGLASEADEIVAAALHPWVWTTDVFRRWQKEEYADAVDEASKSVNAAVQQKMKRHNLGEVKLFQYIYGEGTSTPDTARLRFGETNPHIEQDRRRGAMNFSVGWFTAVRNLLAHKEKMTVAKQHALEYLAALSIIARWADEAIVDDGSSAENHPADAGTGS